MPLKIYLHILFLAVVGSLLSLPACHHKDPSPSIPPCDTGKPFTAQFMGYEVIGTHTVETDTFIIGDNLQVQAPAGYSSYEWQIGGDSRTFTTRTVSLKLDESEISPGARLPVRLIAKGKANTVCFPNDNGIDTVEKVMTVVAAEDAPIKGVYVGYFGSNTDHSHMDTVKIFWVPGYPPLQPEQGGMDLAGINPGCHLQRTRDGNLTWHWYSGSKTWYWDAAGDVYNGCTGPRVVGWLQHDSLYAEIEYITQTDLKDTFKGQRVY